MRIIKMIVPIVFLMLSLYFLSFLLEMCSRANTVENMIGALGVFLLTYVCIVSKLGMELFNINFKKQNKENETN
jgi:hypothetical protein